MKVSTLAFAATLNVACAENPIRLRTQLRHTSEQRRHGVDRAASNDRRVLQEGQNETMVLWTSLSMSAPPAAMCSFCPGGLADPDLVLPTDDQATCSMAQAYASGFAEIDPNCEMVLLAQSICCPMSMSAPPAAMCSFCPGGLADPDLVLPTPNEDTCTDAMNYAASLTADNSECAYVQGGEILCCPTPTTVDIDDSMSMPMSMPTTTVATVPTTVDIPTTVDSMSMSMPTTTVATVPTTVDLCSCSPRVYNFVISLNQDCDMDTITDNAGITQTFCFLGTTPSTGLFRASSVSLTADSTAKELTDDEMQTFRQLATGAEIVSVQFVEFDTSGEFIVINQDGTYSNVSLSDGATVTFTSISSDLDPTLPISDQLELLPGGLQLVVTAKVTDDVTGEVLIVDNRVAWAYTNECGIDPLEVGEGIAWVTLGEHTDADEAFCPAASAVTTAAPVSTPATGVPVTEAPASTPATEVPVTEAPASTPATEVPVTEAPVSTPATAVPVTEAPVIPIAPIEIDDSMSMSISTLFGTKSAKAKALKSKTHAKTEKNPMAKVHKSKDNGHLVAPKSGKSSPEKDAKAEKEKPTKSGKMSKKAYHMFSKGQKMSTPVDNMSLSLSM